ncbi:MAG: hypothetical protein IH991_19395 [Planctomycetes bacterium]|nr:hypothetical protein [Planctomycetota bacterium]
MRQAKPDLRLLNRPKVSSVARGPRVEGADRGPLATRFNEEVVLLSGAWAPFLRFQQPGYVEVAGLLSQDRSKKRCCY